MFLDFLNKLAPLLDAALGVFTLLLPDLVIPALTVAVFILVAQIILTFVEARPCTDAVEFEREDTLVDGRGVIVYRFID